MLCRLELPGGAKMWNHGPAGLGGLFMVLQHEQLDGSTVSHRSVVPGGVSRVQWEHLGGELCIWNVHNYGLAVEDMGAIEAAMRDDLEWAHARPMERMVLMLEGLNMRYEGVLVGFSSPGQGAAEAAPGVFREWWVAKWRGMRDRRPLSISLCGGGRGRVDARSDALVAAGLDGLWYGRQGVHSAGPGRHAPPGTLTLPRSRCSSRCGTCARSGSGRLPVRSRGTSDSRCSCSGPWSCGSSSRGTCASR